MLRTFISIHAAREGGDEIPLAWGDGKPISIHAAREGGDAYADIGGCHFRISIHAAREGGDGKIDKILYIFRDFNPRRP